MVRRANRRDREAILRKPRTAIIVATEGINSTEKNYFRNINNLQNDFVISFAPGNSTDPIGVVEEATRSAKSRGIDRSLGEMALAICDTDFGKGVQIVEARRIADQEDVELILSNPCFEVWLLLHFRYSTKGYYSNDDALNELIGLWSRYSKGITSFDEIVSKTGDAIENSERLVRYHEEMGERFRPEKCNPSSEMHRVMKMFRLEKKR